MDMTKKEFDEIKEKYIKIKNGIKIDNVKCNKFIEKHYYIRLPLDNVFSLNTTNEKIALDNASLGYGKYGSDNLYSIFSKSVIIIN